MQQYSFAVVSKATGQRNTVECTARNEDIAYLAVEHAYASTHKVMAGAVAVYSAHKFFGEIDASECREAEYREFAFDAKGNVAYVPVKE